MLMGILKILALIPQSQKALILHFHQRMKRCDLVQFELTNWPDIRFQQEVTEYFESQAKFPIREEVIKQSGIYLSLDSGRKHGTE
jgi:hypothetical protein